MSVSLEDVLVKASGHIETDVGQETLLLSVKSGRYFSFDGTARDIWVSIDREMSVRDIVEEQIQKYDVDPSVARDDTLAFLGDLLDHQLVAHRQVDSLSNGG